MRDATNGHEEWMKLLTWDGMKQFYEDPRKLYWFKDSDDRVKIGGYYKSHESLEFMVVFGAGHFVPTNQLECTIQFV